MKRLAILFTIGLLVAAVGADWSPTAQASEVKPDETLASVILKVDVSDGHTIEEVAAQYGLVVDSNVLASRGIYLVHSTDERYADPRKAGELADRISRSDAVDYAEPDLVTSLVDTRFHAWPNGSAEGVGADASLWSDQAVTQRLRLSDVHAIADGAGTTVAVLDTGVDSSHPALAGRLVPGWDYVDDDADASDELEGAPDGDGGTDTAYGHGTFVSGVIALVAPEARIMPLRVLDSNGTGNVFVVSQAILDAAASGADVINLSFGTARKLKSHLLEDAIKDVRKQGVVVVAAAGNLGNERKQYPAAQPEAVGVGALAADTSQLTSFSGFGDWVDVAAPGEHVVGPVPGGGYAVWDGTSVAAPFVAGQVALIEGEAPALDVARVVDTINRTTDKLQRKWVHSGAIDLVASVDYARDHPK